MKKKPIECLTNKHEYYEVATCIKTRKIKFCDKCIRYDECIALSNAIETSDLSSFNELDELVTRNNAEKKKMMNIYKKLLELKNRQQY